MDAEKSSGRVKGMKKVSIEQAKKGMVVGKAVCAPDGDLLCTPGTVLEQHHIKELLKAGIRHIYVKAWDEEGKHEHRLTRDEIHKSVRNIFRSITTRGHIEPEITRQAVNDVLRNLLRNRNVIPSLTEVRGMDNYIFTHSVNVCMLSLLAGVFMKLKADELKKLGMAALLHDLGRIRVPQELLYKTDALTEAEFEEVKKHTQYGYTIIKALGKYPESVALAALQHHERMDGTGYPKGLRGEEISLNARIIAIADVFDALLSDRPFRKAFYPHQAVEILQNSKGAYDPEILPIFIENVIIYPPGTVVSLNNSEIGVVVDVNAGQQMRPVVRIILDGASQPVRFIRETDLSKNPHIYICRVLKDEHVAELLG